MKRYVAIAAIIMSPITSVYAGTIDWMVANGFQLFQRDEDFQALKTAWPKDATAEAFLATQDAEKLRELLPINRTWWDRDKGLYNKAGLFKPTHDVLVRYNGAPEGATCAWSLNGKSVGAPIPCSAQAEVRNVQENKPFDLSVSVDNGAPQILAGEEISTSLIVGLGDSFASGEGNPDFAAKTSSKKLSLDWNHEDPKWMFKPYGGGRYVANAQWWDETCHRSLLSWQSLYAMKKAVADPHLVVRFASFSCSGGEVYDGYFRAQLGPPGAGASTRVRVMKDRDGGNPTKKGSVHTEKGASETVDEPNPSTKRQLNKSQLNATIDLLCAGETRQGPSHFFRPQRAGLRDSPYYGTFKYDQCNGQMRKPDKILMSFGGNDFGFSGVVTWGLFPKTEVKGFLSYIRKIGLNTARNLIEVIEPIPAGAKASGNMSLMYSDIAWTFNNALKQSPESVMSLVYPNPLPVKFPAHCSERMKVSNEALAALFIEQTKYIPFLNLRSKYFIFRVERDDAALIKKDFIDPLQTSQRAAIHSLQTYGWKPIEAQDGFLAQNGMRSMCGVTPECQKGACDVADLSGWIKEPKETHASLDPIENVSQWEAYAPHRMRGLRTSNDALLLQASFDSNGKLRDDWFSGSVHPVAQVHAGIADAIDKK